MLTIASKEFAFPDFKIIVEPNITIYFYLFVLSINSTLTCSDANHYGERKVRGLLFATVCVHSQITMKRRVALVTVSKYPGVLEQCFLRHPTKASIGCSSS